MPLPDDPGVPTAQALEAYFEYALNGIIEATAQGRVVRGNPAAASILGRSRRRLDGASLEALLAHDDETRSRLQRHRETIAEQGVSLATLQVAIDGALRTIELASIDVGDGRHLHILDDITEQRQLTASLEAARRAAEEANAAKSAFLANMSHEIRTPLNGIMGIERLLRLTPLTAQQTEYLDDLRRAARVLLALLGDVLDLSKIEAGRFELEPRAFDADEFLETVATACAPAAADKPVRVVFDIDPGVPWHWHGDPLRLAQAVNNLLANAIKFTPSGHVVLAVSWMPVSEGRGRLRLAVRDTGIGMSAEQLERVFSPFVQADPSVTRRFGGTGLGLAIARGIVERMGGELTAASQPAAGSEFVIDLPMDAATTGPPRDQGPAQKAIVVSRDPRQATALARLLEAQAHAVELRVPAADPTDLPATDAETLLVVDDDTEGDLLEALRRAPRAGPVILLQARASATGAFEGEPGVALLRPPATPLRLRRAIAQCRRRVSPGAFDANADEGLHGEFSGASALLVEDHAINRRVAAHLLDYAGIDVAVAVNGEEACAALLGRERIPWTSS